MPRSLHQFKSSQVIHMLYAISLYFWHGNGYLIVSGYFQRITWLYDELLQYAGSLFQISI